MTGFFASETIKFTWRKVGGSVLAATSTDSSGTAPATFKVPKVGAGRYDVYAEGSSGRRSSGCSTSPATPALTLASARDRAARPSSVPEWLAMSNGDTPVLARDPFGTSAPETLTGSNRFSTDLLRHDDEAKAIFRSRAEPILERHRQQTVADIADLRARYGAPVFGLIRVWDLVTMLGGCVDPTDERLHCASQLVHVLQILEQMEVDGVATPDLVLVALTHDLGKLLLLTAEDPANIVCMNTPVGDHVDGQGLDRSILQWNHDEFAYQRLSDHMDDELAWLVRYHSLDITSARRLMDTGDRERTERLLVPFAHYDHATKSAYNLPAKSLSEYRDVIEEAFPQPIAF